MEVWAILCGLLIAGFGIWEHRNLEFVVKVRLGLSAMNLREIDLADHPRHIKRAKWEARLTAFLGVILIVGGILNSPGMAAVLFFLIGFIGFVVIKIETL